MSVTIPTPENFKEKAKVIRKFLSEKYNVDVSHSHCMEVLSHICGFKDWNTASAAFKAEEDHPTLSSQVITVGDMKRALASFDDSAILDACYDFRLGDFLDEIDQLEGPNDIISQEFSLTLEKSDPDIASFKLKLENESLTQTN